MNTDKIIVRSIWTSLLCVLILIVFMVGVLLLAFPSTMMGLTYSLGMDEASIYFAERSYKDSGDIYYISYATEVAIGDDNYAKIESCGERFIAHTKFNAYCEEKNKGLDSANGTYEQYVYVNVCLSKYQTKGGTEAARCAIGWTEGFPKNNPMAAVLFTALERNDSATVELIRAEMDARQGSLSASDSVYFANIYTLLAQNG